MANLVAVDELPTIEREGNARVSGPIVEDFLASGMRVAKVTDVKGKAPSTKAILQKYVDSRELPLKVFIRKNEVYIAQADAVASDNGTDAVATSAE